LHDWKVAVWVNNIYGFIFYGANILNKEQHLIIPDEKC